MSAQPTPEHVHQQRYDGDDPYLICHGCGQRWDALTGLPIGTTTGLTLRPDRPLYPNDPELRRLLAVEAAARAVCDVVAAVTVTNTELLALRAALARPAEEERG